MLNVVCGPEFPFCEAESLLNCWTFQKNNGLVFAVQFRLNSIRNNTNGFCMTKVDIIKNRQII